MIEINYTKEHLINCEHYRLAVTGHAMTANPGQDLVCASVSSLIYGLCAAVAGMTKGSITDGHMVCRGGYADLDVWCAEDETCKRVEHYMEPVLCGLRKIAKEYPLAVKMTEVTS